MTRPAAAVCVAVEQRYGISPPPGSGSSMSSAPGATAGARKFNSTLIRQRCRTSRLRRSPWPSGIGCTMGVEMNGVTLALYRPYRTFDVGGKLVCWWTASPYSHCELVLADGYAYSSSIRDGGVRRTLIDFTSSHWDLVQLPWADPTRVLEYYEQTRDDPYGWKDLLLRQVFNKAGDSRGQFCSEWCAKALDVMNGQIYSPGALGDYCKLRIGK